MIELNQYHASQYNEHYYIWFLQANSEFAAHDWIEVNLRSTTPNRQSIAYLLLYIGLIYVEKWSRWFFFLNDETYENNNTFFHIILEYDRPNFVPYPEACLARNSLSESTEIVKSFNDFN